ncbi:MAG: YggT family protein [Chloroflexi bacterium]|nr:YggT family protein [Chloroflexota bacterium]
MQHPTNLQRKVPLRGQSAEVEADKVYEGIQTEQRRILLKTSQFIWLSFGVLEGIIGLHILLKLIGANPENPFTHLIYNITEPFLAPFVGLTNNPAANGLVLEIHAIIALFVYGLLSVLIERLIWIIFSRPKV